MNCSVLCFQAYSVCVLCVMNVWHSEKFFGFAWKNVLDIKGQVVSISPWAKQGWCGAALPQGELGKELFYQVLVCLVCIGYSVSPCLHVHPHKGLPHSED